MNDQEWQEMKAWLIKQNDLIEEYAKLLRLSPIEEWADGAYKALLDHDQKDLEDEITSLKEQQSSPEMRPPENLRLLDTLRMKYPDIYKKLMIAARLRRAIKQMNEQPSKQESQEES